MGQSNVAPFKKTVKPAAGNPPPRALCPAIEGDF